MPRCDINYHIDTRQNYHFYRDEHEDHLRWVGRIIRTDPALGKFDIYNAAIAASTDSAKKTALRQVKEYWPYTHAWIRGITVTDKREKRDNSSWA